MKVKSSKGLLPIGLLEEAISKAEIKKKAEQEVEILMSEKTPLEVYAIAHIIQSYVEQIMDKVKAFATQQAVALLNGEGKSYTLPNNITVTVATTVDNKYNFEAHPEWVSANQKVKQLEVELATAKNELKAIELSIAAVEEPISRNERKTLKLSY